MAMMHMMQRVRHIAGVGELLAELDVLEDWGIGSPEAGAWHQSSGVRRLMVLRFLDRFVERGGWYPARFYQDNYGITGNRLRQAVHSGRLGSRRDGKSVVYPFEGVRRLWPADVTFVPGEAHEPKKR